LSLSSQKYGIRDTRFGKNSFRIPDPGVKKEPDPGSGSTTPVYWNCKKLIWINRDNPAVTKILAVIKLSNECIKDFSQYILVLEKNKLQFVAALYSICHIIYRVHWAVWKWKKLQGGSN
jgi:hypothetical protein